MSAKRGSVRQVVAPEPRQSTADLLGDVVTQSIELVKSEIALAKAELSEKARLYSSAALIMAVGVALGLLAVLSLTAAAIIALATYTGLVASALICGVTLGALATLLLMRGLRNIKRPSP